MLAYYGGGSLELEVGLGWGETQGRSRERSGSGSWRGRNRMRGCFNWCAKLISVTIVVLAFILDSWVIVIVIPI